MTFRDLPSVAQILENLRPVLVNEIRRVLEESRQTLRRGEAPEDPEVAVLRSVEELLKTSLRPVINATGVVLHTNLGRAPLENGYSNLEYDLATGKRGRRDTQPGDSLKPSSGNQPSSSTTTPPLCSSS